VLLNCRRKSLAGSQCGGNAGSKADIGIHGMLSTGVVINDGVVYTENTVLYQYAVQSNLDV
jgi:hypothetical protein